MNSPRPSRSLRLALTGALIASAFIALVPPPPAAAASATLVWRRTLPARVSQSSPLAVDVDGGDLEVVMGDWSGKVHAFRAGDGSNVPGWPQSVDFEVNSSASAADTDGDGQEEIFIGTGRGTASPAGRMYSFDGNGARRWVFTPYDPHSGGAGMGVESAPAIGDINRDGTPDINFGAIGQNDFSLTEGGQQNAGWPFFTGDTTFSSPALADVNGDGQTDYIIGGDASDCAHCGTSRGGMVRAIDGSGRLLWEFRIGEIVKSSPAVGDIDGDGVAEIVFGAGEYWWYTNPAQGVAKPADSTKVFVIDLNGKLKWSRDTGAVTSGSPALADLDGNGILDVAFATWLSDNSSHEGRVFGWNGRGDLLPGFPSPSGGGESGSGVVTADLDGDGGDDILVPTPRGVYAHSGRGNGRLFSIANEALVEAAPTVTDLDHDGRLDILVTGHNSAGTGYVFRYELTDTNGRIRATSWPMFRKDARRTGSHTNSPLTQNACPPERRAGYWMVASDGGIFSFCNAAFFGSTGAIRLNQPIVGMAPTNSGNGYWLVASDGGIFSFGDAAFHGSTGAIRLNQPIVGMAPTRTGNGYWLVASDGGIFSFGDAVFHGSTGAIRLNQPIVGMTPTASGDGYYMVASDGGIFSFGDAVFHGSTGAIRLNKPIVGMAATRSGGGYWMVATDGGIFAFGDAAFHGSTGGLTLASPVAGMATSPTGGGYWLATQQGAVYAFGDAPFLGALTVAPNQPIRALAPLPA